MTAAATKLGLGVSTLRDNRRDAEERGLINPDASKLLRIETKLKVAEKALLQIKKDNVTAQEVRQEIYGLAAITGDPPTWLHQKRPAGSPGTPVTIWSDWHYGEVVSNAETAGLNYFNRAVGRSRVHTLVDHTLDLTHGHMVSPSYPGIVVCLGGDMVSGTIHDELRETNDGPVQQSLLEVQELLEASLSLMADKFGKVFVPCVVGNHSRMTIKPRAKRHVYESLEWNLYCQLERHFKNDPRIQFMIPEETDAHFTVAGHRFLLTHGDTLGVKGGDGIIGAIGPIARGTFKVGRSESQIGRDFDTLLMGHYHTYIPRGDAVPAVVNGALKGYDEYARLMLRVPYSRPSQALMFVHEKNGITGQWPVFVDKSKDTSKVDWVTFKGKS